MASFFCIYLFIYLLAAKGQKLINVTEWFSSPSSDCGSSWQRSSHYSSLFPASPCFSSFPAVNSLRIPQQTWTIFIASPLLFFSLSLSFYSSVLPFCTCTLGLFPSSIHTCLPGNYHLYSSSPLISPSPSVHLFRLPSPLAPTSIFISFVIPHFLKGLPFHAVRPCLLCGLYTQKPTLMFNHFPPLPPFQMPFFSHTPAEPHPTPCLLRGLRRH